MGAINRPDVPTFICLYNFNHSSEKCGFFYQLYLMYNATDLLLFRVYILYREQDVNKYDTTYVWYKNSKDVLTNSHSL